MNKLLSIILLSVIILMVANCNAVKKATTPPIKVTGSRMNN